MGGGPGPAVTLRRSGAARGWARHGAGRVAGLGSQERVGRSVWPVFGGQAGLALGILSIWDGFQVKLVI